MIDLSASFSLAQLTAYYNENSGKAPIKKFSDKKTAIARLEPIVARLAAESAAKKPKKSEVERVRTVSVSARCKTLILEGKPNLEVWEIVKNEFNLDDKKKSYPAWNRSMLVRSGQLSK